MAAIPQRELRNNVSAVLRRAESGERLTVTVDGRPVAELGPPSEARRLAAPGVLDEILAATGVDAEWSAELSAMRDEDRSAAVEPWSA